MSGSQFSFQLKSLFIGLPEFVKLPSLTLVDSEYDNYSPAYPLPFIFTKMLAHKRVHDCSIQKLIVQLSSINKFLNFFPLRLAEITW